MVEHGRDEANGLMTSITVLLEDAHEFATAGQSAELTLHEIASFADDVGNATRRIEEHTNRISKIAASSGHAL